MQTTYVLAAGVHPRHSPLGIVWTAVTAAVMFALAAGKARIGRALDNPVLRTEGRVTMVDALLAAAVLAGLVLNAGLGWWWADPLAGYVLVYYGVKEDPRHVARLNAGATQRGQRGRRLGARRQVAQQLGGGLEHLLSAASNASSVRGDGDCTPPTLRTY